MSVRAGLFTLLALMAFLPWAPSESQGLQLYRDGNPNDVVVASEPAVCLGGGGSDSRWERGWSFLLERARGGDAVVIRSDKKRGGYGAFVLDEEDTRHGFPRMNSVTTIVLESASDANRSEVEEIVRKAELVFFAGGEQNLYLDWITNSRLGAALNDHIHVKQAPIGGTSAGAMILGGIDFSSRYRGSGGPPYNMVTPEDALRDPAARYLDLDRNLLVSRFLKNVITDTHFSERRREGRLVGLMARALYNRYPHVYATNIKGVGVDTNTAFCYDQTGLARVYGAGTVTFLIGNTPIERIAPQVPLIWNGQHRAVKAYVVSGEAANAFFDLKNWRGHGGCEEYWWVEGLKMRAQAEPVTSSGGNQKASDAEDDFVSPFPVKRARMTGECNFGRAEERPKGE
jgi:cyanophycinase-like exopeptidase